MARKMERSGTIGARASQAAMFGVADAVY